MLGSKEIEVPKTSSVPMDRSKPAARKPLITVTLKPGTKVQPKWPFAEFCDEAAAKLAEDPKDTRDQLAAMITAPQNERFAQVIANRIWSRFMGRGIVEPVDDWEKGKPTHPELLKWLGREFVRGGYDMKHLARLILNSHAYQRATDRAEGNQPALHQPRAASPQAEQIVDSLFAATGKPFHTEEVCLDIDNTRDLKNAIHLGKPHRSWMLTSTSNERDRPSLSPAAHPGRERRARRLRLARRPSGPTSKRDRPQRPPARHPQQRHRRHLAHPFERRPRRHPTRLEEAIRRSIHRPLCSSNSSPATPAPKNASFTPSISPKATNAAWRTEWKTSSGPC
jgi:hypothetical protein